MKDQEIIIHGPQSGGHGRIPGLYMGLSRSSLTAELKKGL